MNPISVSNEYPFETRTFRRGDQKMSYLDEGSGPAVVMVHGNPTWSYLYRNLVKGLRGDHRVVVPDHIGCGFSDKPADSDYRYTLSSRIDDLESLLDHLEIEDATLVVHDWGGAIGFGAALRRPQRFRRLVVINSAAFRLPAGRSFPWVLRLVRNTLLGAPLVRGLNLFCRGSLRIGTRRGPISAPVRNDFLAPYDSWANRIAILRFVEDIPLKEGDRAWRQIVDIEEGLHLLGHLPMMLLWGERDPIFDSHFLAEWLRRFPNARTRRFPDCGHLLTEDAPGEILDEIRSFLEVPPRSGVRQ